MFEPLIQRLKRLSEDERGVSPVVGFVLIFALIMLVFTIYQADVVPAQNEEVEFEHSQTIEGQMEQLSAAFMSVEEDSPPQSVALQLGVEYPSRVFGINPGNPVGGISTSNPHTVELTADGKTQPFETKFVNYQPNYNLMQEETLYSIEYGMLVKNYDSSEHTSLAYEGSLFSSDGSTINVNLIAGNLQANEMSTVVSADYVATHEITVDSTDATLVLPTKMEKSDWESMLLTEGGNMVPQLNDYEYMGDRIGLDIKEGKSIRIQKTSTGDSTDSDDELGMQPFIERVSEEVPDLDSITDETQTELEVRTIDVFGNSYSDQDVDFTRSGGSGTLSPPETTSDSEGLATVTYDPAPSDAGKTIEVTASVPAGSGSGSSVTFELEYPPDDSGSNGGSDGNADVSVDIGSSSTTNPKLHVSYDDPIEVSKFSMTTTDHGNLADLETTNNPNAYRYRFRLNDAEVQGRFLYESQDPIKLDGTVYDLTGPNVDPPAESSRVSDTDILIDKFDSSNGIDLTGVASSESNADLIITLIGPEGSEHPIYLNAEH